MMKKQKIILKVNMNSDKCRTKAMRIAAVADGVSSVAIEGLEKDKLVVVGVGIDSASLAKTLGKKFGWTSFVSVAEVKPDGDANKKPEKEAGNCSCATKMRPSCYMYGPPQTGYDMICYQPASPRICSIM